MDRGRRAAAGVRAGPDRVARLVRHRDRGRHQHAGGRGVGASCASTSRRSTTRICPGIDRDPDTGFITGFTVRPDNVASFRTAGLDIAIDYHIETGQRRCVPGAARRRISRPARIRVHARRRSGQRSRGDSTSRSSPRRSTRAGPAARCTLAYGINWFGKTDRFTREALAGDPDYSDPRYFKMKEKWDHEISVALRLRRPRERLRRHQQSLRSRAGVRLFPAATRSPRWAATSTLERR